MATSRRCQGKTKLGKTCRAAPRRDTGYCNAHSPKEVQEKAGFGGAQPGAGRPRHPRVINIWRERIEADFERYLKPFEDAIDNLDDPALRLRAAMAAFDRVFGKPPQALELASETPLAEIVAVDAGDPETRKLAHALLARAAGRERKID